MLLVYTSPYLAGNEGIDEVYRGLRKCQKEVPPPGSFVNPLDECCHFLVKLHRHKYPCPTRNEHAHEGDDHQMSS